MVLNTVQYFDKDEGRLRPIIYRLSFAEMVVPYAGVEHPQYASPIFDFASPFRFCISHFRFSHFSYADSSLTVLESTHSISESTDLELWPTRSNWAAIVWDRFTIWIPATRVTMDDPSRSRRLSAFTRRTTVSCGRFVSRPFFFKRRLIFDSAHRLPSWRESARRTISKARHSDDCYRRQLRTLHPTKQSSISDFTRFVGILVHLVAEDGWNDLPRDWSIGCTESVHARARRVGWRIWNGGCAENSGSSPPTYALSVSLGITTHSGYDRSLLSSNRSNDRRNVQLGRRNRRRSTRSSDRIRRKLGG